MLYQIVTFYALLQLSLGKRLLQQVPPSQPEFVPVQTTAAATTVAPIVETTLGVQPEPIITTAAATTAAATTAAATTRVITTAAATTAAATTRVETTAAATTTAVPLIPIPGLGPPPGTPITFKDCSLPYTDNTGCAGKTDVIENPLESFQMSCSGIGGCAQSHYTLEYNKKGGRILSIDTITYGATYAGWGASLTIDNKQGGNKVVLERLKCLVPTACDGLTIILNNAHLNDMDCPEENYCANCFVKLYPLDPQPKECYGW